MTPYLVQEALQTTPRIGQEQFVFLVCQQGAEASLKSRWLGENSPFRLAFSRPGLLTFKIGELPAGPPAGEASGPWAGRTGHKKSPAADPSAAAEAVAGAQVGVPRDWMIRLGGLVLGTVRRQPTPQESSVDADAPQPVDSVSVDVVDDETVDELVDEALALAGIDWDVVHVFARDRHLPGLHGFEPGPDDRCRSIAKRFAERLRQAGRAARVNVEAEEGQRVLDVILVEPQQWLIGHHVVGQSHERWPGGAYDVLPPTPMVSRAYLKMAEAIAWSGLPIQPGDCFVEIGSAPGGACQRLLDLGLKVTGIDPAAMDPLLLAHPRFEHWRGKSSGIRRKMYSKFRWLAADANVAPNYTLDAVEDIVSYKTSHIAGLLLTLKMSNYLLADQMDEYLRRVRSWGYQRVEVRQLASNRRECCLVAERR